MKNPFTKYKRLLQEAGISKTCVLGYVALYEYFWKYCCMRLLFRSMNFVLLINFVLSYCCLNNYPPISSYYLL